MDIEEAKKRIEKLRRLINHHRYLYHVLDREEMPPEVLDSLKHELYGLEQKFPGLITPDSPTQRVAGKPLKEFKKTAHKIPMLSLEDIFSEQEFYDWRDYLKRLEPLTDFDYFCELKIDGFAVSLKYKNCVFFAGATRGDGKIGEDITQNLKTIESIPLNIGIKPEIKNKKTEKNILNRLEEGEIEIRGEVYMDKEIFKEVNQEKIKKGEAPYANPRNLAAGSIRQLDPRLAASRKLKFLAYDIITDIGLTTHSKKHEILEILGFKTDAGKMCRNEKEVLDFWQDVGGARNDLPFQIDGVVVSVNENSLFNKLGIAGKSPRAARALKFSPQRTTTRIKEIRVQIGRTGAVTPVAILEPAKIGGVVVSRATLHNADEIKRLGLKIRDTIVLERAGDVIPIISEVLKDLRSGEELDFKMPSKCPACEENLSRSKDEVILRCLNKNCPAKKREYLYHFVSKKAFNVEGLGKKIIDQLVDNSLVRSPADIFRLKASDLISLDRFAEKSASNLIEAIEKSKMITLARFLYALGINHVGEETAADLAKFFGNINDLKKASIDRLIQVPNIGEAAATSIRGWFNDSNNLKLLSQLSNFGVSIKSSLKVKNILSGKKFVITGSLKTMTREKAKEKIVFLGGRASDSVDKKTDYLVCGENAGSKIKRAKKLGIKTISENDFISILSGKP